MSSKNSPHTDYKGLARLITAATIGITDLVEAMHRRVVHPPFLPSTPVQHLISNIAEITFKSIRGSARLIGDGADIALEKLASGLEDMEVSEEREAMRSIVNGVIGDYLEENENPLAIGMQFRKEGKTITLNSQSLAEAYPAINGKILVMVHGLCMNDIQWSRNKHNHGEALAEAFHKTPIYLHYNTGRHTSTNGKDFNRLLEELVQHWPVPVEELVIVAHSMGGLVSRSAFHYGKQEQSSWTRLLKKIVFLGTPHQGAPLEKAGNYVDVVLEAIPYAKPFARLGKIRSAGITDLRYGNLVDTDWQNSDRFHMLGDQRQSIPLPEGVDCYSIAGALGEATDSASSLLLGDNMVRVSSALGQHEDPAKSLDFRNEHIWVAHECSHFDLLSKPEVYSRIVEWIA